MKPTRVGTLVCVTVLLTMVTVSPTMAESFGGAGSFGEANAFGEAESFGDGGSFGSVVESFDETVIVNPGSTRIELPFVTGWRLESSSGANRGQLVVSGSGLDYLPDPAFWAAGLDVVVLQLTNETDRRIVRMRLVSGRPGWRCEVGLAGNPIAPPSGWTSWTIEQGGGLTIVPGLYGDAYVFDFGAYLDPGVIEVTLDDCIVQGGATSSTTVDVDVRDIPDNLTPPPSTSTSFFRILEAGNVIAEVFAEWDPNEGWRLYANSPYGDLAPASILLVDGKNRVEMVRWTHEDRGGTDVRVNDFLLARLITAPHVPGAQETFQLMLQQIDHPDADSALVFEVPTARRDASGLDPWARVVYESFDGGFDGVWLIDQPNAMAVTAQPRVELGDRLEIDLGYLEESQSSFLALPAVVPQNALLYNLPGPDGLGVRFWVDPSQSFVPVGQVLTLLTGCRSYSDCTPFQLGLEAGFGRFTMTARVAQDGGDTVQVSAEVFRKPFQVEVRMRPASAPDHADGYLELWIDGVLIERHNSLANASSEVSSLRFGLIEDVVGSTGVMGLDDLEVWTYD